MKLTKLIIVMMLCVVVSGCVGFQDVKDYEAVVIGKEYKVVQKPIVNEDKTISYEPEILEVPKYEQVLMNHVKGSIIGTSGQKITTKNMTLEKKDTTDAAAEFAEKAISASFIAARTAGNAL